MRISTNKDVYTVVTEAIIEAMEKRQIVPWRKTWTYDRVPMNYSSQHEYRGINAILCGVSPYETPYFLTMNQVNQLGGKVTKGSKSIPIVFWKNYYKNKEGERLSEAEAKETGFHSKQLLPKHYRVFNIEDVEGVDFELPEARITKPIPSLKRCEDIIKQMPQAPVIKHGRGFKPSYLPLTDQIRLPERNQFERSEEYYVTAFHELIHSTGADTRLKRTGITKPNAFGSPRYSEEELVAEIGASFLATEAGIDTKAVFDNSASYIDGWLKALKGDKKMVVKSASQARKATEYILEKSKERLRESKGEKVNNQISRIKEKRQERNTEKGLER